MIRTGAWSANPARRRDSVPNRTARCRHDASLHCRLSPAFPAAAQDVSWRRATRRSGETTVRATTKLRTLLASGRIAVAPGAFDGLSARLVEQAGFPAVYASGGAIARSAGVPDLGLMSVSAIVDRLASMVDVVEVPIIADADTGYGNALNAQAAARAFERAGVAAFHLEDQTFPEEVRPLRRQEPRAGRPRWCRSSRPCAMPCTTPISSSSRAPMRSRSKALPPRSIAPRPIARPAPT